jgi:cysteine desulfuration protein SufE
MNKPIQEIEDEIVEEFELFDEREGKYDLIIDMGKKLKPLDPKYLKEDYLVRGCQAKVWLHAYKEGELIFFEADSDAIITKGIIALLMRALSGQKPKDILDSQLLFIDRIHLRALLTSQRSNGLTAMIQRIKAYAGAFA